ncbi:uncharacterized protein B0H18DRAFT_512035 [Fomitopsis serialis]|uniref:uncharacterized protein n=1 Tax=Fomitopsis serialis TaxID=139415 RepID=UPI0020079899|nr:uncharacterized protein B0H18DRAFT_512035 [Neoantrodia serialis]KAH9922460.1 hypothetical protein B0H18DRAFT_512035 [Neoantrodia serialis]
MLSPSLDLDGPGLSSGVDNGSDVPRELPTPISMSKAPARTGGSSMREGRGASFRLSTGWRGVKKLKGSSEVTVGTKGMQKPPGPAGVVIGRGAGPVAAGMNMSSESCLAVSSGAGIMVDDELTAWTSVNSLARASAASFASFARSIMRPCLPIPATNDE